MKKFFGRESEMRNLSRFYDAGGQSVALVYGRRRVGKSELVKQALKKAGLKSVYYECKQTSEANNVESLALLVSEELGYPRLAFDNMETLLRFLFEEAEKDAIALVLDEYPYLRDVVRGLDSVLQSIVDGHAGSSRMKLLLCGSYVDVMKSLLEEENPLYGRVDLTIHLKPMDYFDSALFYPSFSDEDKVRLYSVFGGIPHYNRLIDPSKSVRDNVIDLVASPGARFEGEVSMYLRSEIRKIVNANEVFEALAAGHSRFGDILSQSHVSSSPTLVDVLDKLVRMEVVSKEAPINAPNNRKKTGYYISDNMSLFYYRYVFKYASQMSVMDPVRFYERFVERDFEEQYVPRRFERICSQWLVRRNIAGSLADPFFEIGKYYYDIPAEKRNGEFDIVTRGDGGYVFYEVKFRSSPVSRSVVEQEISQVQATDLDCNAYGFIARCGFENFEIDRVRKYTLADVYRG